MQTFTPDTHRLLTLLRDHGFTPKQAQGIHEALQEIDLTELATKADLQTELKNLELRLVKWILPVLLGQVAVFAMVVKWLLA